MVSLTLSVNSGQFAEKRLKVLDLNHENDLKTQITKYISLISKTLGFEYEKADCIEISPLYF